MLEKIKNLFKEEKKDVRLKEKLEKRFIPSARQYKAVGEMSKFVIQFKDGTTKAYGWSQMFEWLRDVDNPPSMDLTFGRSEPHESFREIHKGELKQRREK